MTFEVVPSSESDDYVIIQITDTHLLEHPDQEFIGMNPDHSFAQVLEHIQKNQPKIDLMLHTGDLAQSPTPTTYTRYQNLMGALNLPVFQTMGNHDDARYFPFHGQTAHEPVLIKLGQWRIILLNSAVFGHVDGCIGEQQLNWLVELLIEHQEHPTILACHHHLLNMQSAWIDAHKLKNSADIFSALEPFKQVKAFFYGHVHQDSQYFWKHIECFSTPSTCVQFKPLSDQFSLDQALPGYRVIKLKASGEIETQVFRVEQFNQAINMTISGY